MQTRHPATRLYRAAQVGLLAALVAGLPACSPDPTGSPSASQGPDSAAPPTATATGEPQGPSAGAPAPSSVLALEGLGSLRLGQPLPAGSGWSQRGAQVPGPCTTLTSPEFPGAYAIVEEGSVRRITVGSRSDVKLREGIGVGTPEGEVRATFPQLREESHKYLESPAKYLTAPDASPRAPALRFEIGPEGRVALMHAGIMPVLAYVEGCA